MITLHVSTLFCVVRYPPSLNLLHWSRPLRRGHRWGCLRLGLGSWTPARCLLVLVGTQRAVGVWIHGAWTFGSSGFCFCFFLSDFFLSKFNLYLTKFHVSESVHLQYFFTVNPNSKYAYPRTLAILFLSWHFCRLLSNFHCWALNYDPNSKDRNRFLYLYSFYLYHLSQHLSRLTAYLPFIAIFTSSEMIHELASVLILKLFYQHD